MKLEELVRRFTLNGWLGKNCSIRSMKSMRSCLEDARGNDTGRHFVPAPERRRGDEEEERRGATGWI
jgi:hypothetical protein